MNIVFAIPGFPTSKTSREGQAVRRLVDWCASQVGSCKYKPGAVVFSIDRAFNPRASNSENAAALETLLACLTGLDSLWLDWCGRRHVPLYRSHVYYERTLVWDTIPALYARGFGDCKSLSACRIAEIRRQGNWCRPTFRHQARVNSTMFHILLDHGAGTWEDPSKAMGMLSYQESPGDTKKIHWNPGFGSEQ